jgi:UTP-glucose-1-phosphate uridylyltransferase
MIKVKKPKPNYHPSEVAVFVSSPPEEIGEMERALKVNVKMGQWVLTEETLHELTKPVLKGKKGDRYLTLSAIRALYPMVNVNKVYFRGVVLDCYEKNGSIIIDKLT